MRDLTGRRALVTGAGRRVGAAIARALGARKMHVAVHFHSSGDGAERTAAEIRKSGGSASLHRADLSGPEACRALVLEVERDGDLEVLVPSAANFHRAELADVAHADVRRAFSLNAEAPLHLAIAASGSLRRQKGAIVFVTDAALTRPPRHYLPYLMSKAAVAQLMSTLAVELAPDVRVNAVAPGTVLPPEGMSERAIARLLEHIPLDRVGAAENIAAAVVHLASSEFVTGHELGVDGGHRIGA
jgi:pteridine reductase